MEEKIDKLIQGQIRLETKIEQMSKQKNDHEKRIRSLETKFWTALGTFFVDGLIQGPIKCFSDFLTNLH